MPASTTTRRAQPARGPLFWTVLLALLVTQALAFYLLCSHQVRKADARRIAQDVQLMAFSDCLQYVEGSTIGSCTSRLGRQPGAAPEPPAADARILPAGAASPAISVAGR
jgi:hypothetical protein